MTCSVSHGYPSARTWPDMIMMAMSMLPLPAWIVLKYSPGNQYVDAMMRAVAAYFDLALVTGNFDQQIWTRYDNIGPIHARTSNLAEDSTTD